MITNEEQALKLEEYYDRGILKKEVRSYEVSLWTLLDEFITVLKWSDVEQKGRIENPKMTLNIDGTENFDFSIPMKIYLNGQLVENPNWYTTRNGNLIESLRKVKVIFNKATALERVFEFLIVNIQESHEEDILTCNLKCENLAFHELGKIGYKINLLPEDFENDYYEWSKTLVGDLPIQSLDYWCRKMGLRYRGASNDSSREWFYRVEMDWHSFEDGTTRDPTKVYEETFTVAWDSNLRPIQSLEYVEKARPVTIENSNMYNITQTLAETFGIFCRYEYDYDENYHIIGRNIIFYNSFNAENFGMLGITYPYNSSNISRTIDSSNLTTKLFVLDANGTNDEDSYSIMNAAPNASKEDYILNFDYLYKTGAITQEQYDAIKPYEIQMRQYNEELITLHNNLAAYLMQLPEALALKTLYERAIDLDTELLALSTALLNTLDAKDGVTDGLIEITENNPDTKIINNHIVDLKNTNKGIQANTLKIYSTYTSAAASGSKLTNQITSYICHYDEHGNLDALHNVTPSNNTNIVYMIYKYDPQLYYEAVANTWNIKLGLDTNLLEVYTDLVDELENNIEQINTRINELTNSENGLMVVARRQFELLMGPALREGYWQPEEYNNYGDVYSIEKDFLNTGNIATDTGTGAITVWDATLFPEEDKAYYLEGISGNNINYVCINLQELFPNGIPTNIDEYSLVFNSNYVDPDDEPTAIYNLSYYAIGSLILLGFIKRNKNIIPALIFIGSKNMTDAEIKHMKNSDKGRARLSIVGTTNGLINGNESQSISIGNAWLTSNSNFEVAYPRIKFSSLNLKTDTSNLIIWYGTHLLELAKDYYINTRNILRNNGNYYLEYFITIKPAILFKYGQTLSLLINYVMSNACTAIYLDAKKVSIENAYPQVSYEVDINTINNSISQELYNRLALIVTINDTDLKLEDAYGYISEINLDLDNILNDTIEIKNYKNKFEDMFATILAQTEAMKYNGLSYNSAAAGLIGLASGGFALTLEDNKDALNLYFNEYYNNSPVVLEQLLQLFTEAGEILASSAEGQNKLTALTMANAHTLNGFVANVANELTSTVYRSEFKPESFKRGDIWIRLKRKNGLTEVFGRYIAVANSSDVTGTEDVGSDTAGFVRTYDGTLASITGANLNIDAVAGTIDVEAENYINIKSGNDVYIAANNDVDILGNHKVNIGGSEINLCSMESKILNDDGEWVAGWEEYNSTTGLMIKHYESHIVDTTGINLVAGTYNFDMDTGKYLGNNAHVSIRPHKIEMGAAELKLMASSKINLITSTGDSAGTSAIVLDANKGIDIGSGAGIHIYSGTATPEVYVGPTHKATFNKGDLWIQTSSVSGHYEYKELGSNFYAPFILDTYVYPTEEDLDFEIILLWKADDRWDEYYNNPTDSPVNGTLGWTEQDGARETAITWIKNESARGASIELNQEHLLLGYSAVTNKNISNAMMEFTQEQIVLGVGTTNRTLSVNGTSTGLVGVKINRLSIGLAVRASSIINAILMDDKGVTVGSGVDVTLTTATLTASSVGSFVRVAPSGVYIGSSGELYIDTTNFLINSKATGANSLFELRSSTDWYLKYSLQNGLLIKGQVTAIGSNGLFIADGSHFGLYDLEGNAILTLNLTALTVGNDYTFNVGGNITINSDNLVVNPTATGNNILFKAMNGSNGIIVEGDGDTTITGTINATGGTFSGDITATGTIRGGTISGGTINGGSINITNSGANSGTLNIGSGNNSLSYDSSGNLVVHGNITANDGSFTGTIYARELHVGTSGSDIMSYNSSSGLDIGNGGLTYNNNTLTVTGDIIANSLRVGTNGSYLLYNSTNGLSIGNGGLTYDGNTLAVTGDITANSLMVGTNGSYLSYNSTNGLNIGNGGLTYNDGVLTVDGSIYAKNLYLGTGTDNVLTGNYISASYIKFDNGVTVSLIGIDDSGNILLSRVEHGNDLDTKVVLRLDERGIMLSALSASTANDNTYTTSEFSLTPTGITINSGGNLSVTAAGAFTVTAGNFLLDASGNCTIGNTSGNYMQYSVNDGSLIVIGNITATTLTVGDSLTNNYMSYNSNDGLVIKGHITASSLYIVDNNLTQEATEWINAKVTPEAIWLGVTSRTGGSHTPGDGATALQISDGSLVLSSSAGGETSTVSIYPNSVTLAGATLSLDAYSELSLTSGQNSIILNSTGISLSGTTLNVTTGNFSINSGATGTNYVINSNNNFSIDARGYAWINKLAIYDPNNEISGTHENGYIFIDFSSLDFKEAVTVSLNCSGETIVAKAKLWGRNGLESSATVTASADCSIDASSHPAYGYKLATVTVTCGRYGTLTFSPISINVEQIEANGWNRAANVINYNDGDTYVTVPSSGGSGQNASSGGGTEHLDITATYLAGKDSVGLPSIPLNADSIEDWNGTTKQVNFTYTFDGSSYSDYVLVNIGKYLNDTVTWGLASWTAQGVTVYVTVNGTQYSHTYYESE